jgi:hypothetical protein
VPQTGKARDDRAFVQVYPKSREGGSFYAQLAPQHWGGFGGNNAVQIPVTWEMFRLHDKVMAFTVADDNGKDVSFTDLCFRSLDGSCSLSNGYLWYWNKDFAQFLASIGGSTTDPLAGNQTAFREQVSSVVYPDGQPVSLLSVFGGTDFSFNPFQLKSAAVIASDYTLDDSVSEATAKRWWVATST